MAATSSGVHLVNDISHAKAACNELRAYNVLALDMEGDRLGRHGRISLLQLAASKQVVFVFDVLALGPFLFIDDCLLSPILKNPSIIKLCYDCRCDADALFGLHGVLPQGLYDLQIAYTFLFQPENDPFLKGLHKALQVPGVLLVCDDHDQTYRQDVINRKLATKHCDNIGLIMMSRPLSSVLLSYCAADVIHLFTMYELWSSKLGAWMLDVSRQRMLRYVNRQHPRWCMSRLDFPHGASMLMFLKQTSHHNNARRKK